MDIKTVTIKEFRGQWWLSREHPDRMTSVEEDCEFSTPTHSVGVKVMYAGLDSLWPKEGGTFDMLIECCSRLRDSGV